MRCASAALREQIVAVLEVETDSAELGAEGLGVVDGWGVGVGSVEDLEIAEADG